MEINKLIDSLKVDEKIALVSGASQWYTVGIPRLDIRPIMMSDGPHGLRKQQDGGDYLGIATSEKATCFPPAATSANSWDPELLYAMGEAIAHEAKEQGVALVLGPGINIKRSPLCGRNFEYFSEDPHLTSELASEWINGVQSLGIGTSLKHFAANNQESWRMLNDSVVDPRALREIYLAPFEKVIKKSKPWTIMAAYNKLNGTYCCEHYELLTTILRQEWEFAGAVISDWGAVNDPVLAIKAGLDLEMPASSGVSAAKIRGDLSTGRITESQLNVAVRNVLTLVFKTEQNCVEHVPVDPTKHHSLAQKIATESAVLLKNEDNILPLNSQQRVAIIGEFAQTPRYQGTGSSQVNPSKVESVLDYLGEGEFDYTFARGYSLQSEQTNEALVAEACYVAKNADVAIILVGLTGQYEAEGYDRSHLDLPPNHTELVRRVAAVNPKTVVVLYGGSPVIMPWLEEVKGVLHMYLPGQAGGGATIDLLYGKENPSGKLAESYPLRLEDCPSHKNFASNRATTEYRESVFVGYRYYDAAKKDVLFPFGYGLSYTKFEYKDLQVSQGKVECTITNVGERYGGEVVQLYLGKPKSSIFRAPRELVGFKKLWLEPGESKNVQFLLDERSLAYYNVLAKDWQVEAGKYEISVGSSSRDLHLQDFLDVKSSEPEVEIPNYREKASIYYNLTEAKELTQEDFLAIYGQELPVPIHWGKPFHHNSTLEDLQVTWLGRQIVKFVEKNLGAIIGVEDKNDPLWQMAWHTVLEMPLRSVGSFSEGEIPHHLVQALLAWANQNYFQAIRHLRGIE